MAERQYAGNFLPSTGKRSFRPSGPIPVLYSVRGGAVGGPCLSSTINVQYFSLHQCSFPDDIQYPHKFISFGLAVSSIGTPRPFCSVLAHQQLLSFSLKILKAMIHVISCERGRAKFAQSSQTYIDLVETTANLEPIMAVIHG